MDIYFLPHNNQKCQVFCHTIPEYPLKYSRYYQSVFKNSCTINILIRHICFLFIMFVFPINLRSPFLTLFLYVRKGLLSHLFVEILLFKISRNINATGRCVGKGMCHTTAVSYNKRPCDRFPDSHRSQLPCCRI